MGRREKNFGRLKESPLFKAGLFALLTFSSKPKFGEVLQKQYVETAVSTPWASKNLTLVFSVPMMFSRQN